MPVSNIEPYFSVASHGGNTYPFAFKVFDQSELVVKVDGTVKTLGLDYTVTITAEPGEGGSIIFQPGYIPAAGVLTVEGDRAVTTDRSTDYQEAGGFRQSVVDKDFDRLVMMAQDRKRNSGVLQGLIDSAFDMIAQLAAAGSALLENFSLTFKPLDIITKGPWLDARAFATLAEADVAAAASSRRLVVSTVWDMPLALTLNAAVEVMPGGGFTGTGALNIKGPFTAGLHKIFFSAGVSVQFDSGLTPELPVEWWETNTTPGTTDMRTAINTAIATSKLAVARQKVVLQSTTYGISDSVENLTADALATVPPVNGIVLEGVERAIIKPLAGFPAGKALLNLDGNINGATEPANAVAQNFNQICNITLDCADIADRGLRLRAVAYSDFADIDIINAAGGVNDAALYIYGVEVPTKDDTDATYHCTFTRVNVARSTGWGVLGISNRCGSLKFDTCDFRFCTYDGMRLSFANLLLSNCTFASNGSDVSASTGGFSAVKSATGAVNRGLVMDACQFEANYNHEINLEWLYGFSINGGLLTPYVRAAASQALIKFGNAAVGSSEVEGGAISGMRVAPYSSTGEVIAGMLLGPHARNIGFNNLSWDLLTGNWDSQAQRFTVSASAAGIALDGKPISDFPLQTLFKTYSATSASAVVNVTGDGTELKWSDFVSLGTTFADRNHGPARQKHSITAASISTNTLTVTAITGTPLQVGNRITGTGVAPNTFITALGTGAGGTGTYTINISQEVASIAMKAYDHQWYSKATGIFTAPFSGMYQFEMYWPCTGFTGAETDVEVALLVNPSGAVVRHVIDKRTVASLAAGAVYIYGGTRSLWLNAGDQVTGSIKLSGGTKAVDIYRNIAAPGGLIFSGMAC